MSDVTEDVEARADRHLEELLAAQRHRHLQHDLGFDVAEEVVVQGLEAEESSSTHNDEVEQRSQEAGSVFPVALPPPRTTKRAIESGFFPCTPELQALLQDVFSGPLNPVDRVEELQGQTPLPDVSYMRVPSLDSAMYTLMAKNARPSEKDKYHQEDRNLTTLQGLAIRPFGPMSMLFHYLRDASPDDYNNEIALDLVARTMDFNAHMLKYILYKRRQILLRSINIDTPPNRTLCRNDYTCYEEEKVAPGSGEAPTVFGSDLTTKTKATTLTEAEDALKLDKVIGKQHRIGPPRPPSFPQYPAPRMGNQGYADGPGPSHGAHGGGRTGFRGGNSGGYKFVQDSNPPPRPSRPAGHGNGRPRGAKRSYSGNPKRSVELESMSFQTHSKPSGRLRLCLRNWEKLTSDPFILESVTGFRIPFIKRPSPNLVPSEISFSLEDMSILDNLVSEMLEKGAIRVFDPQAEPDGFYSRLFIVPKPHSSKKRPIINLKPLNTFVEYIHFKMDGIHMLRDLLAPGDFLIKVDLKDAYFSIPVHQGDRKYFRFTWRDIHYEFLCCCFGYCDAPRLFTKLTAVFSTYLRQLGFKLIRFIDDFLFINRDQEELVRQGNYFCRLVENLGYQVNYEKSQLVPTQVIDFLGFSVDSTSMSLSLPTDKVERILTTLSRVVSCNTQSLRDIAEVLGLLNSATQAVLPATLYARKLQLFMNEQFDKPFMTWDSVVAIPRYIRQELREFSLMFKGCNFRRLLPKDPDFYLETDASDEGWGAHLIGIGKTRGSFTYDEYSEDINVRELRAFDLALRSFSDQFASGTHVRICSDNITAIAYINKLGGTESIGCCDLSLRIWKWALANDFHLSAEYIPGKHNVIADRESRTVDSSDWKLDTECFLIICSMSDLKPQIDLFASRVNTQLKRFYSWYPDPHAEAVDAFKHPWPPGCYAFPPFCMVGRVVRKVIHDVSSVDT